MRLHILFTSITLGALLLITHDSIPSSRSTAVNSAECQLFVQPHQHTPLYMADNFARYYVRNHPGVNTANTFDYTTECLDSTYFGIQSGTIIE